MRSGRDAFVSSPPSRRLRRWARRVLPVAVWFAAIALLLQLHGGKKAAVEAPGLVERTQVAIAPLFDGTVHSLAVDRLDTVSPGQVVALMDDTLIRAEMLAAEAELAQLRAALQAERASARLEAAVRSREAQADQRRFALDTELAHLDYLDRHVRQEYDRVVLQLLAIERNRQKNLVAEAIADEAAYDDARLQHDALETQVRENEQALQTARMRLEEARARETALAPDGLDAPIEALIRPFREAINAQEARVQEVKARRATLALKAPLGGRVCEVFHRAGETLLAGTPLLTIGAPDSGRVMAYVPQANLVRPAVGGTAEVRGRHDSLLAEATVLRVAPQVAPLPEELWTAPNMPEWGLPVLLGGLQEGLFYPGERVEVRVPVAP